MKKSMKTSIRKGIVTTVLAAMVLAGGVRPVQADSFMDKIHVTDIKQKVEAFLFEHRRMIPFPDRLQRR